MKFQRHIAPQKGNDDSRKRLQFLSLQSPPSSLDKKMNMYSSQALQLHDQSETGHGDHRLDLVNKWYPFSCCSTSLLLLLLHQQTL